MLRSLRGVLLIVVVLLLALAGLYAWMRTSLPTTRGNLVLSGLSARVEVVRTADGIPHISASSREDAYFALGFVHAQDRLWQMEERRLAAAGRLAEVLGERAVDSDRLMRVLGLYRAAERDREALTPRTQGIVQAYSDGMNAYLERRSGTLPPEFLLLGHRPEPWRPTDVLAVAKLQTWQQAGDWQDELLRTILHDASSEASSRRSPRSESAPLAGDLVDRAELPLVPLLQLMADLPFVGTTPEDSSMAWLVGPAESAEQAPLLALERRGRQLAPSPWYLVHLQTPSFDATGASLPGIPGLFSGMNGNIAWALVESGQDNQDLFVERVRGDRYLGAAGWLPLEHRTETIIVRGGEEETFTVRVTENGPLVSDLVINDGDSASADIGAEVATDTTVDAFGRTSADGAPVDEAGEDLVGAGSARESLALSLAWTALREPDRGLQGLLALTSARNWEEFSSATDKLHEPSRLALYADADGGVGVRTVGRLPVREGFDGRLPAAAWRDAWNGTRPFAELPRVRDPRSGRIVVAGGESPGFSTRSTRSDSAAARRLHRLLDDLEFHSSDSFERLLADEYLPSTARLLPLAREALPTSRAARLAQAELMGWDGSVSAGSPAAPILYQAWLIALLELAFEDDLGQKATALLMERPLLASEQIEERPRWCDDRRTPAREDCELLAARALEEAVSELQERLGEDTTAWTPAALGLEVHRHAVMGETLLGGLHEVRLERGRGSPGRVHAESNANAPDSGPVLRAVYNLAPSGRSGQVTATGQSGNALGQHYRRFGRVWSELELVPSRREKPQDEPLHVLVLEPRR